MDLTESYKRVIPKGVLDRYHWAETRDAAAVIQNTNPDEFKDLVAVLRGFELVKTDITVPGGQRSEVPKRIDGAFLDRGWREGEYRAKITSTLKRRPLKRAGELRAKVDEKEIDSGTYLIDNLKGKIACDVEWHAKDGNLDRDLAAYRALYEAGTISAGVVITREFEDIRDLARKFGRKTFHTTTTTTVNKMVPRLERGDAGGCPVLIAAIGKGTFAVTKRRKKRR